MIKHGVADLIDRVRKGDHIGALRVGDVELPILVQNLECELRPNEDAAGYLEFSVINYYRNPIYVGPANASPTYAEESAVNRHDFLDALRKITEEKKMASNTNIAINKSKPGWSIKQVIFSDPATIVLWQDGSKTVVKCENEVYDPEKGLAMALSKKMLGNKGNYFDVFRKWLPEDYETPKKIDAAAECRPWRIWYKHYANGVLVCSGVYIKSYQRKNDATRVANKVFGDSEKYEFVVSMANPWKEA